MKKINEIYNMAGQKPVFSFEFFPPKTIEGEDKLFATLDDLVELEPSFVSVTYGAGGSTRSKTFDITEKIAKQYGIPAASHFTSVGADEKEVVSLLDDLQSRGIENLVVLRGDPPKGEALFDASKSAFAHASELAGFIKSKGYGFSLGGACYPEKHPEAKSMQQDVANLKIKVDAGVEFLLTQLFFRNSVYFDFVELARKAGISVPVVPGIMPITSFAQIARFREIAGCDIPQELEAELSGKADKSPAFEEASVAFTVGQCLDLLRNGAPGIHFYTLNQSAATLKILEQIKQKL